LIHASTKHAAIFRVLSIIQSFQRRYIIFIVASHILKIH